MPARNYRGFVQSAPAHTNTKRDLNRFCFAGFSIQNPDAAFTCSLRVIPMHGSPSPAEFAAYVAASDDRLPGRLITFPDDYKLGRFTFRLPNGTDATANAEDVRELTPDQLLGRAPIPEHQQPLPKETPEPDAMNMNPLTPPIVAPAKRLPQPKPIEPEPDDMMPGGF